MPKQSTSMNNSTVGWTSYHNIMETRLRSQLLLHPFLPYVSVIGGIFFCKMIYDFSHLFSSFYVKSYSGFNRIQRSEWNNRGISTAHAIFIAVMSFYMVFISDLFSDDHLDELITFRSTALSDFVLGVSVGYFITDFAMITWQYPSFGGLEYVLHHLLSVISVAFSMLSGEGQIYTFMVLMSEITTPGINLRWYLDKAGMKRSRAYVINGITVFLAWLVARILLFFYLFYHVYGHYDQVEKMHAFGYLLVFVVPSVLAVMNLLWFAKIFKGVKKTLAMRD